MPFYTKLNKAFIWPESRRFSQVIVNFGEFQEPKMCNILILWQDSVWSETRLDITIKGETRKNLMKQVFNILSVKFSPPSRLGGGECVSYYLEQSCEKNRNVDLIDGEAD